MPKGAAYFTPEVIAGFHPLISLIKKNVIWLKPLE